MFRVKARLRSVSLSTVVGGVRNLFNHQYADPVPDAHVQDSIGQNGRTLRVGVRWTSN